jgi:hypothetical protein
MTFDDIFEAYYNLYRAEGTTPDNTDDEYTIALRLANEALSRWANFDGTYWNQLYTTLIAAEDGSKTIATGQSEYECPSDMREPGGMIKLISGTDTVKSIRVVQPHETQFENPEADYCYFTGSPATGFVLNFNLAPTIELNGYEINYIYYKNPTEYTTGTDISEIPDPYFLVHRMLAMRFRASRNPYYQSALRDSEDALRIMQVDNNSGSWNNPWKLSDHSGSVWGS